MKRARCAPLLAWGTVALAAAAAAVAGQTRLASLRESESEDAQEVAEPRPRPHPGLDGTLLTTRPIAIEDSELRELGAKGHRVDALLGKIELLGITYLSDGLRVRGYLAYPRSGDALPCVIYNRGGNRGFGALDDVSAALTLGPLAADGYIAVASQYRGNVGGEGREEFGGDDVDDVLNLIPLLEQLPRADAARIGMVGWSRGAMMTYLSLARTDRIAGAIVGGGESDLQAALAQRPEMSGVYRELIPGFAKSAHSAERALAARSAAKWPEKLNKNTPILILQGSSDWRVDPGQALLIARRLYDVRHPFRLVFFEGGDHGLNQYRAEVARLSRDWLGRYVRDRVPWPSLDRSVDE